MTSRNAQFNQIRLKIEIEVKIGENEEKKRQLKRKICKKYKKFDNLTRENSLNRKSNHKLTRRTQQ